MNKSDPSLTASIAQIGGALIRVARHLSPSERVS
jgi:hypothetical protein